MLSQNHKFQWWNIFVFPNSENPLLKSKLSEQRLNESMYVVTAVSLEDIVTSLNHLLAINK